MLAIAQSNPIKYNKIRRHILSDTNASYQARATVDYLTITTKGEGESGTLIHLLYDLLGRELVSTGERRAWKFMGFHGAAYQGVRYGLRKDEAIVMLSGSKAAEFWRMISPARRHCTRIDLAVTVTLPATDNHVAEDAYIKVLENGSVSGSHIVNSRGGATCYVGSRNSSFFGRLYDKGAEEGIGSGACWRYELETKKPASESVLARLLECDMPAEFISSYVYNWFTARGVVPLYEPTNTESAIEIEASVSTLARSLNWLTTQVRPTVGRLIVAGMELEVRDALGLPEKSIKSRLEELGGS